MENSARISELADQCVKCGLCLPTCPTYAVARTEAESPRGRIAFAQALANGRLDATASLVEHLDQCLACMSCERVCPSQVRYGELLVATRATLRKSAPLRPRSGLFESIVAHPRLLRAGLQFANLPLVRQVLQSRAMRSLLRPLRLDRALRELPRLPAPLRDVRPRSAETPSRGRVGLFCGCIAAGVDRDAHAGATRLLQALGYDVVLPRAQGCCGALSLHAGDIKRAKRLAATTRQAFIDNEVDTVLVSASGCFGTLRDQVFNDPSMRVCDIHAFLVSDERIGALVFRPLARRVALHTPCTQANVVRSGDTVARLLARIPQLDIAALPTAPGCCGAAGDYFLRHADIADTLRALKLDQGMSLKPDLLVTSNVGCRIFLDNGLRQRGESMPVVHPIALLAEQLDN